MVNQIISATRYNTLQGRIEALLGVGSGDKGYNNTVRSSAVPIADIVLVNHMNNLYKDFRDVYVHVYGVLPTTIAEVSTADEITEALHAAFEAMITDLEAKKFVIHPTQDAIETAGINSTRTNQWGGSSLPQSVNHTFTANFSTPNARRGYFNAGGEIRFAASLTHELSPGDLQYDKTNDWQTILSNMATVSFKRTQTDASGTGTGSAIGSEDLTTSYQTVFTKTGSGLYSDNEYYIQAKLVNDYTIEFNVVFQDDANGLGGGDEYVAGTLVSTISHLRADGSYVSNPAPAYNKTSDL